MKSAHMHSGLLALLILVAAMPACTNSEQLSSGVGPVPIEIEITNADTDFDRAFFDLTQVTVRPVNPDAAEVLGTNPLWMMKTTEDARFEINLNAVEDGYATSAQLTVGPYQVESITLQTLEFSGRERTGNATCVEYVTDYPVIQTSIQLVDFGEPVIVDVQLGANSLKMVIDGTALATAFQNSFTCAQGAPLCGFFPPVPDWCLYPAGPTGFRADVFASQVTTFLSFP